MTEIKKKRGRPKKNILPQEIQTLIQDTQEKAKSETQTLPEHIQNSSEEWDVPISQNIEYFDSVKYNELINDSINLMQKKIMLDKSI